MKVRDLIGRLTLMDGNLLVVMASDSEGNSFGPMSENDFQQNWRYKDHEVGLDHLTDSLKDDGFKEEDLMEGGIPCVVLWP